MTPNERVDVQKAWVLLAAYYQRPLPDHVVLMYTEDVADLPADRVLKAMTHIRRDPKRRSCPMPADVRDQVTGPVSDDSRANDAAAKIRGSISRFGYTNAAGAEAHIGPLGWAVVEIMGGWPHLCQTLKVSDMGTFYAQCRDLCRGRLDIERRLVGSETPLPQPKTERATLDNSGLQAIGDAYTSLLQSVDFRQPAHDGKSLQHDRPRPNQPAAARADRR